MKIKALLISLVLAVALLSGCGDDNNDTTDDVQDEQTPVEDEGATDKDTVDEDTDATTTPSIVNEESAFKEAISADGTWIIATLNDLTFEEDLVVEGEFYDKGDSENELYRKLAPYTQDEDRNITDRFTITAPKLTIKSPNTNFQGGTFVGDVYVESDGFTLSDAKIDGNLYFSTEEYKNSFTLETESEVTGEIKAQE
ncbi:hypothetical protein [Senegalia massiliensis]|uniref:hypothetical protein n=1 Tax=Senegalia massiliensis TaxID=1720316 RepID=UPI0010306C27|nr:hypothetical protein [Senegalia massiliensis]